MNNQENRTKKMTTARNISRRRSKLTRVTQILGITLTSTAISFLVFLITLTSSHWIMIIYPPDFFASRQKLFVLRSTYGIIWQCFTARKDKKSTYRESLLNLVVFKHCNGFRPLSFGCLLFLIYLVYSYFREPL